MSVANGSDMQGGSQMCLGVYIKVQTQIVRLKNGKIIEILSSF